MLLILDETQINNEEMFKMKAEINETCQRFNKTKSWFWEINIIGRTGKTDPKKAEMRKNKMEEMQNWTICHITRMVKIRKSN